MTDEPLRPEPAGPSPTEAAADRAGDAPAGGPAAGETRPGGASPSSGAPGVEELNAEELSAGELNAQERAEARRYGRMELGLSLADRALDLAYLAVAAFWLARPLDAWLSAFGRLAEQRMLRLAVFYLVIAALHMLVSLPLSFYSGYVVERQFRLSTQSFSGWWWSYAKRQGLSIGLTLLLVAGLYGVIWHTGPAWWLIGAAAFFAVSVVLAELLPVVILPLFYKIEPLDSPELRQRLEGLTAGTGLSIEGIYRIGFSAETVKANAMLAGLRHTRRVLLGDTLLKRFTPEEIEVICAHEIGHHALGHLRKMALRGLVFSAVVFAAADRLLIAWLRTGQGAVDYAHLPVWALPFLLLVLTGLAMALTPLHHALSRRAELEADEYALRRTGLKAAYAAAFRKLARINKDDPDPHWLEVLLFHSHPPIGRRLAAVEQWQGGAPAEPGTHPPATAG